MSEILIKLKVDTENLKNEMKEAEGLAENFGKKIEDKLVVTPKIELKNLKEFRESIKEAAGDASKLTAEQGYFFFHYQELYSHLGFTKQSELNWTLLIRNLEMQKELFRKAMDSIVKSTR